MAFKVASNIEYYQIYIIFGLLLQHLYSILVYADVNEVCCIK